MQALMITERHRLPALPLGGRAAKGYQRALNSGNDLPPSSAALNNHKRLVGTKIPYCQVASASLSLIYRWTERKKSAEMAFSFIVYRYTINA